MLKRLLRYVVKLFIFLFVGLCLLEAFLHIFSFYNYMYISPKLFSDKLSEKDVDVYFVGDSTIYGIGSSSPAQFSLPMQFQELMRKKFPDFKVVNLGVAGSGTEEHLELLECLPNKSTVVYRGGTSDNWRKGVSFRYRVFSFEFEFRTLKMFYMLFSRLFSSENHTRLRLLRLRLQKLLDRKKFRIFTLEYTASYPMPAFYSSDKRLTPVPLRSKLKKKGFGDRGFDKKFISKISPAHANDMGYHIEAVLLFNFFCHQNEFGLSMSDVLSFSDMSEFADLQIDRYQAIKTYLAKRVFEELQDRTSSVSGRLIEALAIVENLEDQNPSPVYREEHRKLDKLLTLFFQAPGHLSQQLISSQSGIKKATTEEDFARLKLYYSVLWTVTNSRTEVWASAHERAFGRPFPLSAASISYLPLLSPYPLEYCQKFIQESGYSPAELSVRDEFEYFFPLIYYDEFSNIVKPACHGFDTVNRQRLFPLQN